MANAALSQAELAEAMGVSRQTINAIETERYTPSLPLAIALARYLRPHGGGGVRCTMRGADGQDWRWWLPPGSRSFLGVLVFSAAFWIGDDLGMGLFALGVMAGARAGASSSAGAARWCAASAVTDATSTGSGIDVHATLPRRHRRDRR